LLEETIQYHEKIDYPYFCAFGGWLNAGVLLERARNDHNHNASNHCNCAAAADYDDHNDALLKRLLIEAWHRHPACAVTGVSPGKFNTAFRQASCPPDATVKMAAL
jgi:hypothetical protein